MSILHVYLHVYFARLFGFQLMVHKWLLGHLGPSSPTLASNFSCYLFYSWFLLENIQQAKELNAVSKKVQLQFFLQSAHLPSLLSPCHAA
jgi:hypothetical protein